MTGRGLFELTKKDIPSPAARAIRTNSTPDDGHRAKIYAPDDQEERHQTGTTVAEVEAEAYAVCQDKSKLRNLLGEKAIEETPGYSKFKNARLGSCLAGKDSDTGVRIFFSLKTA